MRKHVIALLVSAAVVSGCAARSLTYGEYDELPRYPDDYRRWTQRYVALYYVEPESARYQFFGPPQPAYVPSWGGLGTKSRGWVWRAAVNARNVFGGYTGWIYYDWYLDDSAAIWRYEVPRFFGGPKRYRYEIKHETAGRPAE